MRRYVLLLLVVGLSGRAKATQFKVSDIELVPQAQSIEGDMALACRALNMQGTINGDLMVASDAIRLGGIVRDDLWAVGRNITLSGIVGDDVRVGADSLALEGEVVSDVMAGCRHFTLGQGSVIKGNLTLGCAQALLLGEVGQDALIAADHVQIAGTVRGDVKIRTRSLVVKPSARITGSLEYTSPSEADIAAGAQIRGATNWTESRDADRSARELKGLVTILRIALFFGLLITGALLVGLFPRWTEKVADTLVASPWASLGIGVAFLICVPIVAIFLCISLAGIPLAVFSAVVYVVLLYAARIFVALLVGRAIFSRVRKKEEPSPVLAVLLGLVIVALLTFLPYVGWMAGLLITLGGTGAVLVTVRQMSSHMNTSQSP